VNRAACSATQAGEYAEGARPGRRHDRNAAIAAPLGDDRRADIAAAELTPSIPQQCIVPADRKPRLFVAITLAETGGAQSYLAHLLPGLVRHFDVTVAAHGRGPLRDVASREGIEFIQLTHVRRALNPFRDALGLVELYRLLRSTRPDALHLNSSKVGILGALAGWAAGVPVRVFTVHGWAFNAHSGWRARAFIWAHRLTRSLTTSVICVSNAERRVGIAAKTCIGERTVVIENAVPMRPVTARDPSRPLVIASVTRLQPPKDTLTLVRALKIIAPHLHHALIVGDGPDRSTIATAIADAGLADRVELLGDRGDVRDLLAGSDIFVLATLSEGMPLALLEAMAEGLPAVASSVGGVPEIVQDGENGLLVPAGDAAALARALHRLMADADLRVRLGCTARRTIAEHYGLERFRSQHIELLQRLVTSA
jgi:glycosyltransferase involved in cell wall biosynthesis